MSLYGKKECGVTEGMLEKDQYQGLQRAASFCYLCQSLIYLFQIGMWSNVILEISNMYRLGIYVADPPFSLLEPENLLPFSFLSLYFQKSASSLDEYLIAG